MEDIKQYCTFYIGDLFFGVDVREVQEVIRYQEMTYIPLAGAEIGGLINLRGQIVTAIDLRQRLRLQARPDDKNPMNVVIRTEEGVVSLLVDEIGDVLTVEAEAFEAKPETLRGPTRELIEGVYKLKTNLMLVLSTSRAAQLEGTATGVATAV